MALVLRKRYRTGSPVTVRPITSRWISDVPSKIVKIFDTAKTALLLGINAGKPAGRSAVGGVERRRTAPNGATVLPEMLPADQSGRGVV